MATIDSIDITSLNFQEGSAPGTPSSTQWKLYTKTDGLYVIDDAGTETGRFAAAGAAAPKEVQVVSVDSAGDYTTTSTTMVDIDATNLALTVTTPAAGARYLIIFNGRWSHSSSSAIVAWEVDLDGSTVTGLSNERQRHDAAKRPRSVHLAGDHPKLGHRFVGVWLSHLQDAMAH